MRTINHIVVHCSATKEGKDFRAHDIDRWHKDRGWSGIGYHFVVRLDGEVEKGRPVERIGAHVSGHNRDSIGVVYIGGVDRNGKPKDTRTPQQKLALRALIEGLQGRYPEADVRGHRDFPGVAKACPSFDVRTEL